MLCTYLWYSDSVVAGCLNDDYRVAEPLPKLIHLERRLDLHV